MPDTTIPIPGLPAGARTLDVVLNPMRSSNFEPIQLPPGILRVPYPKKTPANKAPANILRFQLTAGPPPSAIPLRAARAPAQIVKVIVKDANDQVLSVYDLDNPQGYSLQDREADPRIESEPASEDFLIQVWEAIEAIPDTHERKASLFFFDYDLNFNPSLWDNLRAEGADPLDWVYPDMIGSAQEMDDVTLSFGRVMTRLQVRINERALGSAATKDPTEDADVELLSRLQLDLYEYYQDVVGMTLAKELGDAFDEFASGELVLPFPSAGTLEPSSGVYFLFGEFALLAMHHDKSEAKWKKRAPFLLRSQEVMASVYAPPAPAGPARTDRDYKPEARDSTKKPDLRAISPKYDNNPESRLNDLATGNVQNLMGGGMV